MAIKVGVIFGGQSVEHEISIISAVQAMHAFDESKYEVVPIYITKDKEWYTGNMLKEMDTYKDMELLRRYAKNVTLYKKGNNFLLQSKGVFKTIVGEIDVAFPIVHGLGMEDGTLQGYLELVGIPYVGSDIYGSVVGQDKIFMKQIFKAEGLPITNYIWFFDNEYLEDSKKVIKKVHDNLKYPVIIKPAKLGSSIGINKANNDDELVVAIDEAVRYDTKIVVEEVVPNLTEVNASVLGNYENQEVSVLEEVSGKDAFLSYSDKYMGGKKGVKTKGMVSTNRIIPAKIGDELTKEVNELAKRVFVILNTQGVARIDFLIDKKASKLYVNEINTIPGSLSFYLWDKTNKDYTKLLDCLVDLAIRKAKKQSKMLFSFDTNILQNFGGLKGAKGAKGKLSN